MFLGLGASDGGFVREASILNATQGQNRVAQVLSQKAGGITYLPQGTTEPPPPPRTQMCWDGSQVPLGTYCPPQPPPVPPTQQPLPPYVPEPAPTSITPSYTTPGATEQMPNPGTMITTTPIAPASALFTGFAIPRWGWVLGGLAALGGVAYLYKRSRR